MEYFGELVVFVLVLVVVAAVAVSLEKKSVPDHEPIVVCNMCDGATFVPGVARDVVDII